MDKSVCFVLMFCVRFAAAQAPAASTPPASTQPAAVTTQTASLPKQFIVKSIMEMPFLKLAKGNNLSGNEIYEGFILDLMNALTKEVNFNFVMYSVTDGRHGVPDEKGNWNGLIGEIKDKDHIAVVAVTDQRKDVVDFSEPIMKIGFSIMANKNDMNLGAGIEGLAYFLSPFTVGSWMLILVSFVTVGAFFTIYNHFHPYEYRSRSRRGEVDVKDSSPTKAVKDSYWFTASTLLLQGFHRSPLSLASRTLAAFWFFFVLVTVATYLAALVYVFSHTTPKGPAFTKLTDLVDSDLQIGAIYEGDAHSYFKSSKADSDKNIYQQMTATGREIFVENGNDAITKVENGGYVFIGYSSFVEYVVAENCNLVQVGGIFNPTNLAIAFAKGSQYVSFFNKAIQTLTKNGELKKLHEKWWHTGKPCTNTNIKPVFDKVAAKTPQRKPLFAVPISLNVFGGPLILLLTGILLSLTIAVVETVYYQLWGKQTPRRKPLSVYHEENANDQDAKV